MRNELVLIPMLCLALTMSGSDGGEPQAIAQKALDATLQSDYGTFSSLADERVNAALTEEAFAGIATSLELQFGEFQSVLGVEPTFRQGLDVFVFTLDFERAEVRMMIAVNGDLRVSGLRIAGAEQKKVWEPPSWVDSDAFREEEVTVGATGYPLPGTLTLPNHEGRNPAVVLLHGSGPNDRDETIGPNKIFKDLAWGLAIRGIAVLRYEKRTRALPEKFDVKSATLDQEVVDDAVAAVTYLQSRSEIDTSRVFVLGHSLGGLGAPYVARRVRDLAGTIVIAAPGRPMLDVLAYQVEHLARLKGGWNDSTKSEVNRIQEIASRGREGRDVSDETIMGIPASYWLEIDGRDAPAVAAETKRPILVIQGGRDYQVTMDCFAIWKANLDGKAFAELVVFDDLNHLMIAGEGESTPEEYQETGHVDERVVEKVAGWILGS